MRVWVVCDHEPLPTDPGDRRLMRAGMLTEALSKAGHDTTWFISSFDHYLKRQRPPAETGIVVRPRLQVRILSTPGYRRNVDLARIVHNMAFAGAFERSATTGEKPDVIVASVPATESAAAAVRFAKRHGIPSVLDIYDMWPDTFRWLVPWPVGVIGTPVIGFLDRQVRFACAAATSLVATSENYLRWGQAKGGRDGKAAPDVVVPLGHVRRSPFEEPERRIFLRRMGIGEGQRIVSFIGTWGLSHDLSLVARAMDVLRDRPDIRFVLAGDTAGQSVARASLARLPHVTLPGWLNAREVATLLSVSEIGLLPYRRGAPQELPNKLFEYMAHGAYQIATLGGETERLYRSTGTGRCVRPTGEAVAGAIRDYLAGQAGRDQRAHRIATFEENFAGSAVYGRMVRHIETVAQSVGRPQTQGPVAAMLSGSAIHRPLSS